MLAEPLRARFQIRKSSDNLREIAEPPVFMQRFSSRAGGLRGVAVLRWLYATGPRYTRLGRITKSEDETQPSVKKDTVDDTAMEKSVSITKKEAKDRRKYS